MKHNILFIFLLSALLVGCKNNSPSATEANIYDAVYKQSDNIISENIDSETSALKTLPNEQDNHVDIYIKDIYSKENILAGTCLSPEMIENPITEKLILNQFNSITMENAMKPENILSYNKSVEAVELIVQFNPDAINMLNWCKSNHMAMRGHTLIWYSQTPDWIFYENFDTSKEFVSREVMLSRMESFIKQVFEYLNENNYSDLFYAYDVVNEALIEDGSWRDNKYKSIIGEDYLWHAFNYARMYAPDNIKLFYNDYNEQYKPRALINLVNTLIDSEGNYLIDGIGLQAHLYTLDDINKYLKAVDILSQTGLTLEVTELDVSLGAWQNTLDASDSNLKAQGKFYYNLINSLIEKKKSGIINLDSITFWGFNDNLSWRKEASPLLFDKACKPKYSFYGAALCKENAGF